MILKKNLICRWKYQNLCIIISVIVFVLLFSQVGLIGFQRIVILEVKCKCRIQLTFIKSPSPTSHQIKKLKKEKEIELFKPIHSKMFIVIINLNWLFILFIIYVYFVLILFAPSWFLFSLSWRALHYLTLQSGFTKPLTYIK